ncbi:MAG: caspase family protein [Rhizobiaceae bacterium]
MMFLRTLIGAMVFAGCLAAAAGVANAANRVALVIGNNEYENLSSLNNPGSDAARLAKLLEGYGFDVMRCEDETLGCFDLDRGDLRDALEDFEDEADEADVALFFYAGHGLQTAEGNVLAPVDMKISCDNWKAKREILLDDVLESMSGAREKIVILDACRNDPFKAQQCLARGARPLSFGSFAVPDSVSRFLLITSTLNGQVARDGEPGTHSPFAKALFHWMEQEPRIKFDQLFGRVSKRVIEQTAEDNFTQIPEILIRGGTPETCLSLEGCGIDPEAEVLRREIAALTEDNLRSQELAEIGAAYLRSTGIENAKELSEEERKRILREIGGASKALAQRNDAEGERALAALKEGNESEAEKLFEEVISASAAEAEAAALEAAERRADANRKAAEAARHIAALARPKDVAKAAKYFQRATEFDPDDYQTWMDLASVSATIGNTSQALRAYRKASAIARDEGSFSDRYWAANGQGDIVLARGQLGRALKLFRAAGNLAEEMIAADPEDLNAKRNRQVSLNRIGNVLTIMGDLNGARAAYSEGLEIATELVESNPDYLGWQTDLAVSEEKMGNVLRAQGDFDGALAFHQSTYERMVPFAEADPNDNETARFVLVTLHKIGDLKMMKAEIDEAEAAYLEAMEIAESLVEFDPGNSYWQRDLAVSDERMGDIFDAREKYEKALKHYRASLDRIVPLIDADPGDTDLKRTEQIRLNQIGETYIELGKIEEALEAFVEGQSIIEALIATDDINQQWKSDLTVSLERVADTFVKLERHDEALEVYQRNLDISRELALADPTNVERQWGWYVALWRIADNTEKKVEHFEQGLALIEKLHAEGKLAPYRQEWIETTRERLEDARAGRISAKGADDERIGKNLKAVGNLAGARKHLRKSVELVEAQIAENPDHLNLKRTRQSRLIELGDVQVLLKKNDEALKSFLDGLDIMNELTAVEPDNLQWLGDLTLSYERVADTYVALGRSADALEIYKDNLGLSKRLAEENPTDAGRQWSYYVALWRIADNTEEKVKYFTEALNLIERLDREGLLAANRRKWIQATREQLENAKRGGVVADGMDDENIGANLLNQEDYAGAKQHILASIELVEAQIEAHPEDLGLKRVRQVRLIKLGDAQIGLQETEAALQTYIESLELIEKLLAAEPENRTWLADLTVSYERVADTYVALERNDDALEIYEKNLELSRRLAAAHPDDEERQWGHYVALWRIADNTDQSVKYFTEALELLERLREEELLAPARIEWIQTTRDRLEEAKLAAQ